MYHIWHCLLFWPPCLNDNHFSQEFSFEHVVCVLPQGLKFIFGFGSTCMTRYKFLGTQLKLLGAQLQIPGAPTPKKKKMLQEKCALAWYCNMGLLYWIQWKQIKELGYFTELGLLKSLCCMSLPLYPIACSLPYLSNFVHEDSWFFQHVRLMRTRSNFAYLASF